MNICEHLTNGILDVELRLPGSEPAWTRFDLSSMISQVTSIISLSLWNI